MSEKDWAATEAEDEASDDSTEGPVLNEADCFRLTFFNALRGVKMANVNICPSVRGNAPAYVTDVYLTPGSTNLRLARSWGITLQKSDGRSILEFSVTLETLLGTIPDSDPAKLQILEFLVN